MWRNIWKTVDHNSPTTARSSLPHRCHRDGERATGRSAVDKKEFCVEISFPSPISCAKSTGLNPCHVYMYIKQKKCVTNVNILMTYHDYVFPNLIEYL